MHRIGKGGKKQGLLSGADSYIYKLKQNIEQKEKRGGWQRTCALLTDIREVVVAGNVVPAPTLMCHHYHTILPAGEEIVWLVLSPVLVLLQEWGARDTQGTDVLAQTLWGSAGQTTQTHRDSVFPSL